MGEIRIPTSVKPEVVFVEELLTEILSGQLRVPRFQRPFVWDASMMRQLLDSIYRGYPIGSLLIWDSPQELTSFDKVGPIAIPDPPDRPISYVLDGHQRLTTLLCALFLPSDTPLTRASTDWKFWLFFDLASQEFIHISDGRKPPPSYFPLRSVLRTMEYLRECEKIKNAMPEKSDDLLAVADEMAQRLKSYKIPVTRIKGGSPGEAVEIFARLNSSGVRITSDQMVAALTYQENEQQSLADHIDDILIEMETYNFGGIPRKQILQSILGAAGLDINMNEWEAISKKLQPELETHVGIARRGLLAATRFLYEEVGVPGNGYLPYVNQIVLLAAFFWSIGSADDAPGEKIEDLKKWFWRTSLTGWFAGANPSQLRDMLKNIEEFAEDANGDIQLAHNAVARPIPTRYDSRSARIRCLMIFLFSLVPMYPDGSEIDAQELSNERRGSEYVFTGIHKELLSSPANRVLLPKKPGMTIRNRLLSTEEEIRPKFLKSHCIPQEAHEALGKDEPEAFIELRKDYMFSKEAEFMRQFGVEPYITNRKESADEPEIDAE